MQLGVEASAAGCCIKLKLNDSWIWGSGFRFDCCWMVGNGVEGVQVHALAPSVMLRSVDCYSSRLEGKFKVSSLRVERLRLQGYGLKGFSGSGDFVL